MKVITRYMKPLTLVAASLALIAVQATAVQAAPNTISVSPDNPTKAATGVTYTWLWSGFQTATAVKCVKVQFSTDQTGSTFPGGMAATGLTFAGTYLTGQTYTADNTDAAAGITVYNNTTGVTPAGSAKTMTLAGITNPTNAQTLYMRVTTYDTQGTGSSGICAGSILDSEVASAVAVTDNTVVSVTVDPSFAFSAADRATACNSELNPVASDSDNATVALGRLQLSSVKSGGQDLSVSGNAGAGSSAYVRSTNASDNLRKPVAPTHNWTDVTGGTYASPATFTGAAEQFGYTYNDATAASSVTDPAAAAFIPLTTSTADKVMGSATSAAGSGCIAFSAQTSNATPAGTYTATVIYTAVPVF